MILVPKRKELVIAAQMPSTRFGGFFKLDAIKPDGRVRPLTGWFPNLITNNGLDLLGAVNSWNDTVCVGSGNTAPAITDTALVSVVAATTTQFANAFAVQSSAPYYGSVTKTWQFAQGAAAGNLAEVGVGKTSTNLLSRALIVDGGGAPTTITVLATEYLNVTYQLRMLAPTADVTGTVVLGGIGYNYTIRASRVTQSAFVHGWLLHGRNTAAGQGNMAPDLMAGMIAAYPGTSTISTVTGGPSGIPVNNGTAANSGYSSGSYNRDSTYTWAVSDGNLTGGIGAIEVGMGSYFQQGDGTLAGGRGNFQIGFATPIPKDNTKQLTLNFRLSWTRV